MREVDVSDAFRWLLHHSAEGLVAAVLPDAAEVDMEMSEWRSWYVDAAYACLTASAGPTVFLATDRKVDGHWISKPRLLLEAADWRSVLWHKIALRRPVSGVDPHRPTYSHLIAFGPGRPGGLRPDVIDSGQYLWRNGIGVDAARFVVDYIAEVGAGRPLINPFCGVGTLLAAANERGLEAYGCDTDPGRANKARTLELPRVAA